MIYIISFLLGTMALSWVLTRLMISLGPKLGLIDEPGERRIHVKPIPRAGGIAVWVSSIAIMFLFYNLHEAPGKLNTAWFKGFFLASLLLVVVGIIDDRFGMNAWLKLGAHALSAVILFYVSGQGNGILMGIEVPKPVELIIWVVWTVAIINAFNLIDGMDGLCAGLGVISVTSLMILSFSLGALTDAVVLSCMVGALLGFLRYNFNPAKIFLGDTGSMFIGFFIASVALVATGERFTAASLLLPLIVAGIPLIDVMLAVWRRSFQKWLSNLGVGGKGSIFGADQNHLHHRLLAYGLTQRKVAVILYAVAIAGSIIALLPSVFDHRTLGLTMAALFVSLLIGFRYLAPVELSISGEVFNLMIKRPPRSKLNRFLLSAFDMFAITIAAFFAYIVTHQGTLPPLSLGKLAPTTLVPTFAITMASALLALNAGKAHIRRWGRASLRDFVSLGLWLFIGMILAITINAIISDQVWETITTQIITFSCAGLLIIIPRSVSTLVREGVVDSLHRNYSPPSGSRPRVLLYGAGDLGELFLDHVKVTADRHLSDMRIIGMIDDHPELESRFQDGFRIHGNIDSLEKIILRWELHGIIITMKQVDGERMKKLLELCASKNIQLYRWSPDLDIKKVNES